MTTRNYTQTLSAGQTIRLPAGRFFMVKTASAVLDITTEGNTGAPVQFFGISAGSRFGPVAEGQGWQMLAIYSATSQIVEVIISDDGDFDVANVVTVSGGVTVVEQPSSAISTPTIDTVATGAAGTIAANLSRKRITICAPSTNTGSMYVQQPGAGAGRGIELQQGMFIELKTTAAIGVRNDSGATQNFTQFEET